jgi:hypothetical protein
MISLKTSLEKLIGRVIKMPAYDMEFKVDDYKLKINPSELKRFWFGRPTPFYNGTNIWLDLTVLAPRKKDIGEDLNYTWELVTHKENKPYQNGQGSLHLSTKDHHTFKFWMNKKTDLYYSTSDLYQIFTKSKAIHIEPILDIDTYDLVLRAKGKEKVICQFTLQNIDEYGREYHNMWSSNVVGIVFGFLLTLIIFLILRK